MQLNIPPKLANDLKKLSNQVNLPAERLAELFVEDGVNAYLYTHDGPNALRENLDAGD